MAVKYPFVGVHKKDNYVVSFKSHNFGIVIASAERTGPTATDATGEFEESEFKKIWEHPTGE